MKSFFSVSLKFLLIFAVFGIVYLATLMTPGAALVDENVLTVEEENIEAILKESEDLEQEFINRRELGNVTDVEISMLKRSIALQEAYITKSRTTSRVFFDRLRKLNKSLSNELGKDSYEKLKALLNDGEVSHANGDLDKASKLFREANNLQNDINLNYADSDYADIRNSAKIDHRLKVIEATPIYYRIKKLEDEIKKSFEGKDWKNAQEKLTEAIDIQTKLNNEYPGTSFASFSKIREFESELDSLRSSPLEDEINTYLESAKKFFNERNFVQAAEDFQRAYEAQKRVNEMFSKSKFFSEEKLRNIKIKQEKAISWETGEKILSDADRLKSTLEKGDFEEINLMREVEFLLKRCDQFNQTYKSNDMIPNDLVLMLRYLNYIGKNIFTIQETIKSGLLPIDVSSNIKMFKYEIPQSVYGVVMQENPSRVDNPKNPVESISWDNANEFCKRLSWILGRKVSLPTMAQYKDALGSLKYIKLDELAWNADNSGLRVHEIGTKKANDRGFYDLLGNVSEFLKDCTPDGYAIAVGGNAQIWSDSMIDVPIQKIEKSQRGDRMLGFRVIVE